LPTASLGQTDRPLLVDQIAWVDPPDWLPVNATHGTFWSTSPERKYDPYIQACRLVERSCATPGLQMLIGTSDVNLGRNRQFRSHLKDLDVPYEYAELAGVEHNLEEYLDASGPELFDFFSAEPSALIA
jgi:hypothetical protein